MAIIKAPNKNYNGVSANVSFRDGTGETEDAHLIVWFREHGYRIEEREDKPKFLMPITEPEPEPELEPEPEMEPQPKSKRSKRAGQEDAKRE